MRLTCRTLADGVAPPVLSHISISAKNVATMKQMISNLQFLTIPEGIAAHCTKITIENFSSVFPDLFADNENRTAANGLDCDVKKNSHGFLTALSALKFVRTVKYVILTRNSSPRSYPLI